jgi:hypothetical protein
MPPTVWCAGRLASYGLVFRGLDGGLMCSLQRLVGSELLC